MRLFLRASPPCPGKRQALDAVVYRLHIFAVLFVYDSLLGRASLRIILLCIKSAHSAFSGVYVVSMVVVSAGVALFRI